jgi:hypothetical protein
MATYGLLSVSAVFACFALVLGYFLLACLLFLLRKPSLLF